MIFSKNMQRMGHIRCAANIRRARNTSPKTATSPTAKPIGLGLNCKARLYFWRWATVTHGLNKAGPRFFVVQTGFTRLSISLKGFREALIKSRWRVAGLFAPPLCCQNALNTSSICGFWRRAATQISSPTHPSDLISASLATFSCRSNNRI